jgi:hypothetical protein
MVSFSGLSMAPAGGAKSQDQLGTLVKPVATGNPAATLTQVMSGQIDAVTYKFIPAPLTAEQVKTLIQLQAPIK